MDTVYGEVETNCNALGATNYEFSLLEAVTGADNDTFRSGEIMVPQGFELTYSDRQGIHIRIPYIADQRRLMIRFTIQSGSGGSEYLRNPTSGSIWFPIMSEQPTGRVDVSLAQYTLFNAEGNYNLLLRNDYLALYSGEDTDFEIGAAKAQNEAFLLKTSAGNLYRHPTTGVGLIDFLHSNMENNGLAAKMQAEFQADKMIIKNAYIDSSSGELLLETEEMQD